MKKILIILSIILAALAIYFCYEWYLNEPDNREPLPALLTGISSLITLVLALLPSKKPHQNQVDVQRVQDQSKVDIIQQKDTDYNVKDIDKSEIKIR